VIFQSGSTRLKLDNVIDLNMKNFVVIFGFYKLPHHLTVLISGPHEYKNAYF
jgi:hypothetical protein